MKRHDNHFASQIEVSVIRKGPRNATLPKICNAMNLRNHPLFLELGCEFDEEWLHDFNFHAEFSSEILATVLEEKSKNM